MHGGGIFGLGGIGGGMFLNKLVKHIPDYATLTEKLRSVLQQPTDEAFGGVKLRDFSVARVDRPHGGFLRATEGP